MTLSSFIRSAEAASIQVAGEAGAQRRVHRLRVVAALAADHGVEAGERRHVVGVEQRRRAVADVRPGARLRGGEEDRLDAIEIVLGAHALEEHRSDHAPPSDDANASHCHDSNCLRVLTRLASLGQAPDLLLVNLGAQKADSARPVGRWLCVSCDVDGSGHRRARRGARNALERLRVPIVGIRCARSIGRANSIETASADRQGGANFSMPRSITLEISADPAAPFSGRSSIPARSAAGGGRRSVTTPRVLGVYAIEWPPTPFVDEVFGPLGGSSTAPSSTTARIRVPGGGRALAAASR
jgi:hypothetical protein